MRSRRSSCSPWKTGSTGSQRNTDALLLLADQLDEFHKEFRLEAERLGTGAREIAEEEDTIRRALEVVAQWSGDNDHPVAEWFSGE